MGKPLAATDRRRNAGHKRPRRLEAGTGETKPLAQLFNDRRHKNAEGRRAS